MPLASTRLADEERFLSELNTHKKMKFEWEQLSNGTVRAKVIGGWIVRNVTFIKGDGKKNAANILSESMVFVSDANYQWMVDKS